MACTPHCSTRLTTTRPFCSSTSKPRRSPCGSIFDKRQLRLPSGCAQNPMFQGASASSSHCATSACCVESKTPAWPSRPGLNLSSVPTGRVPEARWPSKSSYRTTSFTGGSDKPVFTSVSQAAICASSCRRRFSKALWASAEAVFNSASRLSCPGIFTEMTGGGLWEVIKPFSGTLLNSANN